MDVNSRKAMKHRAGDDVDVENGADADVEQDQVQDADTDVCDAVGTSAVCFGCKCDGCFFMIILFCLFIRVIISNHGLIRTCCLAPPFHSLCFLPFVYRECESTTFLISVCLLHVASEDTDITRTM